MDALSKVLWRCIVSSNRSSILGSDPLLCTPQSTITPSAQVFSFIVASKFRGIILQNQSKTKLAQHKVEQTDCFCGKVDFIISWGMGFSPQFNAPVSCS
nr:hypothetical protein CFP56_35435 [Quercus suber]